MNDFVSKPFDMKDLFSKIITWLPKPAVSMEPSPSSVPPNPVISKNQPPPDVATDICEQEDSPINRMALINVLGSDTSKHIAIVRKFITQAENIDVEINAAHKNRNLEQIAFLAHKLKSSARTVGADTLADLCVEMEKAGRDGDWSAIETLCPELVPAMERVADYINKL